MKNFTKLVKREFKLFLSNTTLLSVFILAPLIYAIFIGFTYRQGKVVDIPVIVVDYDRTSASTQLTEMLNDNKTIKILPYSVKPANIKDEIIRRNAAALVVIPERFEAMMLQGKYPEVNTYVNTSNLLTANFASKSIQTVLGTYSAGAEMKALQKRGMSAEVARTKYEPFKANYITLFNTTGNYLVFMWPAIMAVVLQQVIMLAMAVSFAEDFKRKDFLDIFGKENKLKLMLIKIIPVFLFSNINLLMFYFFGLGFRVPGPVNWGMFLLNSELFILASIFLAVFMSILIPNALKATQVLMVIASPAFIMSGFTWPAIAMPSFINAFTSIVPLTPYLSVLKISLVERGGGSLTTLFTIHLLVLIVVFFMLSWLLLIIKKKKIGALKEPGPVKQ
ncbi:ABC transporter permease [Niabella yanshanensis]|uniref:ABC transporter permease n=1 Tax=Niabella yanshanensis TaxID=577386 RepID=A0ABZ0WBI3_9BACT|nr:ABC transporter permease [Niabella yanshanensis]WQD40531.1 ABC transporter permease [Niabella yanshanensis]